MGKLNGAELKLVEKRMLVEKLVYSMVKLLCFEMEDL